MRGGFNPNQLRDPWGRWIKPGQVLDMPDGSKVKVLRTDARSGRIQIQRENGVPETIQASELKAPKGGSVPHSSPEAPTRQLAEGQNDGSSPERAIDVGDDVDRAAQLLGEGKHVKLRQTREVSTLLDKLAEMVADAKAKGEDAPVYDLCKVSVPHTNLFCAETKGVPRAQMPQLSGVPLPGSTADGMEKNEKGEVDLADEFIAFLQDQGIEITEEEESAAYLKATQSELNGAKVAGMMQYERGGTELPGSDKGIFVSQSGYVIDGHHRWAARVGQDAEDGVLGDVPMKVRRIDADIITLLDMANQFAADMGIPQAGVAQTKPGAGDPDKADKPSDIPPGRTDAVSVGGPMSPEEEDAWSALEDDGWQVSQLDDEATDFHVQYQAGAERPENDSEEKFAELDRLGYIISENEDGSYDVTYPGGREPEEPSGTAPPSDVDPEVQDWLLGGFDAPDMSDEDSELAKLARASKGYVIDGELLDREAAQDELLDRGYDLNPDSIGPRLGAVVSRLKADGRDEQAQNLVDRMQEIVDRNKGGVIEQEYQPFLDDAKAALGGKEVTGETPMEPDADRGTPVSELSDEDLLDAQLDDAYDYDEVSDELEKRGGVDELIQKVGGEHEGEGETLEDAENVIADLDPDQVAEYEASAGVDSGYGVPAIHVISYWNEDGTMMDEDAFDEFVATIRDAGWKGPIVDADTGEEVGEPDPDAEPTPDEETLASMSTDDLKALAAKGGPAGMAARAELQRREEEDQPKEKVLPRVSFIGNQKPPTVGEIRKLDPEDQAKVLQQAADAAQSAVWGDNRTFRIAESYIRRLRRAGFDVPPPRNTNPPPGYQD